MNRVEIESNLNRVTVPANVSPGMHRAYQISRYTYDYILSTLTLNIRNNLPTRERFQEFVESKMNDMYEEVLPKLILTRDNPIPPRDFRKNVFTFSNTDWLSRANNYTRLINKRLGEYLEDISKYSPYCFCTEREFEGLKLTGIDVIFLRNNELVYAQLKTKRDTLTGSQVPRSRIELSIHDNSMFVSLLDLGPRWTFSKGNTNIERVFGEEFWSSIGLYYDVVEEEVARAVHRLEQDLFEN